MSRGIDIFGNTDPRKMPPHFFFGAVSLDCDSAIKAEVEKQNYSVCPREWYLDARYECRDCGKEFIWTKEEQRAWFEEYRFWVDSQPNHCKGCRKANRELKEARKEYDTLVERARSSSDMTVKRRILDLIGVLEQSIDLPEKIQQTKATLAKQIESAEKSRRDKAG